LRGHSLVLAITISLSGIGAADAWPRRQSRTIFPHFILRKFIGMCCFGIKEEQSAPVAMTNVAVRAG
jgi:hypothetical protein